MITQPVNLSSLLKSLRKGFNHNKIRQSRQTQRGRPSLYSSRTMLAVFMVMTLKGISSFKMVHKFLKENPKIRYYCGLQRLPHRSTLSRRLRAFFSETLKGRAYSMETQT
jgi:hypothetical protein